MKTQKKKAPIKTKGYLHDIRPGSIESLKKKLTQNDTKRKRKNKRRREERAKEKERLEEWARERRSVEDRQDDARHRYEHLQPENRPSWYGSVVY